MYARWGGQPAELAEVDRTLNRVARRQGWTFAKVPGLDSCASYRAHEWQGRYGEVIGWTLLTLTIAAVSSQRPVWGLPPEFHLISSGPLHDALSADGSLVLPDADWLLAPLSDSDRAALRASGAGNGWEAYNFKSWKPSIRAEALFTHWD
ncbi:hypothetical protein [Deinococcus aluminii]|uniref:Uncharacterized protein n=1 Tax=Deinococcus aluminii TaxID=1656885 RepID=A0ABP9XAS9_9DEIO